MKIPAVPWRGFVMPAFLVTALFVGLHLAGFRDRTGVLSGTDTAGTDAILGGLYILAYLATVVVVPVLFIACVIVVLFRWITGPQDLE